MKEEYGSDVLACFFLLTGMEIHTEIGVYRYVSDVSHIIKPKDVSVI